MTQRTRATTETARAERPAAHCGDTPVAVRPAAQRVAARRALAYGVSISAMLVAAGPAVAAPFGSLRQALSLPQPAANALAAASNRGGATAARQAGLGAQNVAAAAAKFRSLNQALAGMTYRGPAIPNGIAPGGLQQADGVAGQTGNSALWSGANPTLGTSVDTSGITEVTVTQTQATAALTWKTFNIGAKTRLAFDQSAATRAGQAASSWVAINSVEDPNANPSTILGQITAPGKVYVLNRNGVLFGAGSQVNVSALIASSAVIAQTQLTRDAQGLISGVNLYGSATGQTARSRFNPTFVNTVDGSAGGATFTPGPITVEAGASIQTAAPASTSTQSGGYVMLLGGTVRNDGVIASPRGQVILAAGDRFALQPGYTQNPLATVIGSSIDSTLTGQNAAGTVTNNGILLAGQGDITLLGHEVTQAGIVLATSTVNTRGTVHLLTPTDDTTGAITLAQGSITEVVPVDDGSTALNSQHTANITLGAANNAARLTFLGATLNTFNVLPDNPGIGRVEISTGGSVTAQGGALVLAPGAQIAVGASNIALQSGSTLDVSGVDAKLSAAANNLYVASIVPFYLRDSAANRDGTGLRFASVYLDQRTLVEIANGAYAGNIYTRGGLLEVGGNLNLVGHTISEWSALGGQVTLQARNGNTVADGGTVTVASGATINLTGGTVTYEAGLVRQSYVQTTDGRIFNINEAPANLVYAGVYTGTAETHPRWQVTERFVNPLLTPSAVMSGAYTIGRDAGTLTVSAATGSIAGTILAGVTVGQSQSDKRPRTVTDPFLLVQTVGPQAGAFILGNYTGGTLNLPYTSSIVLGHGTPAPGGTITVVQDTATGTISIDSDAVSGAGFANLAISTAGDILAAGSLSLSDGGTVTLSGESITVLGDLVARGGQVTLTTVVPVFNTPAGDAASASVTIGPDARLIAAGQWTNLQGGTAPGNAGAYRDGGTISVVSTGALDAGGLIDVSGGGLYLGNTLTGGAGGSVLLSAGSLPGTFTNTSPDAAVALSADIRGYGVLGADAGTLTVSAPRVVLGTAADGAIADPAPAPGQLVLPTSLLATGFAAYRVNGFVSMDVADGARVQTLRPAETRPDPTAASGALPGQVFDIIRPNGPFLQRPGSSRVAQRPGASLALTSVLAADLYNGGGGAVTVGAGARVGVDPGQTIAVEGYGQVTVLGTLTAQGGTIMVANTRGDLASGEPNGTPSNLEEGLSVWLGEASRLDASGASAVFRDAQGRRYGIAQNGGAVLLGSVGGADFTVARASYAQVIQRAGSVIDASGAAATVDIVPGLTDGGFTITGAPVTLVGNGGTIVARSYSGVALDGTVRAQGGGAGAAGGTLAVRLDPFNADIFSDLPAFYLAPRQVLISQTAVPGQTDPKLSPGTWDTLTIGQARVSQEQLDAGGFDTLDLTATDGLVFEGDVALSAGRAIVLRGGLIGDSVAGATVSVAAPYVSLRGYSQVATDASGLSNSAPSPVAHPVGGSLTISANLLDARDVIVVGGSRLSGTPLENGTLTTPVIGTAEGFANLKLDVTGDIRLTNSPAIAGSGLVSVRGTLASGGDIAIRAAQLYPLTGGLFTIYAGLDVNASSGANAIGGTLSISRATDAVPSVPYAIGGSLALVAGTIQQNGVVRAPLGQIRLGARTDIDRFGNAGNDAVTTAVTFGPGSVTSVSLEGATVPYGGTADGVTYLYNGSTVPTFAPLIEVNGAGVTAGAGARLDISGGGTLAGAAFVYGRGGSADVNRASLLSITNNTVAAGTGTVFAILPGYGSDYAPSAPGDAGYATPTAGARITIADGQVPGLKGGTYTLLPAYYDLLPGAFRVELTGGSLPAEGAPRGNFTTVAPVTLGTANTGISSPVPVAALFTSGTDVRRLAQYNEQSYSTFQSLSAATFNAPRPFLPQDGATLRLSLAPAPKGVDASLMPVSLDAAALRAAPAAGGRGATLEIITRSNTAGTDVALQVLPEGGTLTPSTRPNTVTYGLSDSMLSALDVSRIVLGGTLTTAPSAPNSIFVVGITPEVSIAAGAELEGGDLLLTAASSGNISVGAGATLSTIGRANTAISTDQGFYFLNNQGLAAYPVLGLSNGRVTFAPSQATATGAQITVADGAVLRGGGSLNFAAPQGTSVRIGNAALGARYVALQVANINIGDAATLAGLAALPPGLLLDQSALQRLVGGSTTVSNGRTLTVPAAEELTLTANQSVNIVGSVALDSRTTDFTLYTPAIYGFANGDAAAAVSITAPVFTWGGLGQTLSQPSASVTTTVSGTPGGQILGSGQNVSARFAVNARDIVFGFGPARSADTQTTLDRALVGFQTARFSASGSITANGHSTLAVYATQPGVGQAGSGGDVTFDAPLITTAPAAIFGVTAGGTLTATTTATGPASTASVGALGGRIDLAAQSIALDTAIALHSGRLTARAASGDIALSARSVLDLSGRDTPILDQTANSAGGTLTLEAADGTSPGNITQAAGGRIDVSSPGAQAGAVTLTAAGGTVALAGTLAGSAGDGIGAAAGGTLAVNAASLGALGFDGLNAALDAGGFTGARRFALRGDLTTDRTIRAHAIAISVDGALSLGGTLDASGATPGSIALYAGGNLGIAPGTRLDAHATTTSRDSYGQAIDANNRARVTLASAGGSVVLGGGSTIDVRYADSGTNPQGIVSIAAPRTANGLAVSAADSLTITGARDIDLLGQRSYSPTDANGTVVQDNGGGRGTGRAVSSSGTVGLAQIDADSRAWMTAVSANTTLSAGLAGLVAAAGDALHLAPGVEIVSGSAGKLTISGDLDFSGYRYSAPAGFGLQTKTGVTGSGEAGQIAFRAAGDLTVNGSVTDGFAPPPDSTLATPLAANTNGWVFVFGTRAGAALATADSTNSDIYLPASSVGTTAAGTTQVLVLNTGTRIATSRPISLNYDVTVNAANVRANTVIPFAFNLSRSFTAPAGGFIATAPITRGGTVLFAQGALVPSGFAFAVGDRFGAGSVVQVASGSSVQAAAGTRVPAGTRLQVFADPNITLSAATDPLPVNAFIPTGMAPVWAGVVNNAVQSLTALAYRAIDPRTKVQGYLYPLAQMLPSGSRSWDLGFAAGADLTAADPAALRPASSLSGGEGRLLIDDQHAYTPSSSVTAVVPAFSVIRTGTGDLWLSAGGDITQASLYGIYTAGTQSPLGKSADGQDQDRQFNPARQLLGSRGALLPGDTTLSTLIANSYQAYYPDAGGDLTVTAQGDLTGDVLAPPSPNANGAAQASDLVSNWLWRQGSPEIATRTGTYQQPTSWWINFGTFLLPQSASGALASVPQMVGFQGWGALGGGNVRIAVGGNAGQATARSAGAGNQYVRGEGLVLAVGSTGRILPGSDTPVLTGGGSLTLDVAGAINGVDAGGYGQGARNVGSAAAVNGISPALNGDIVALRGDATVRAGAVGRVDPIYPFTQPLNDPRSTDPFTAINGVQNGGLTLAPGDATISIRTDGDAVVAAAADPTRTVAQVYTALPSGLRNATGGATGFTLWRAETTISITAQGGSATPTTLPERGRLEQSVVNNGDPTDFRSIYPPNLYVTAIEGNIVYGTAGQLVTSLGAYPLSSFSLETMPAPNGQVSFLAGNSIWANGYSINISGADPAGLSTPLNPTFTTNVVDDGSLGSFNNYRAGGGSAKTVQALFAQAPDTPTTNLHADDTEPARFYAARGDIVNFQTGETLTWIAAANETLPAWYLAAKPVQVVAGRDIVSSGTRPVDYPGATAFGSQPNQRLSEAIVPNGSILAYSSGNLALNNSTDSVSRFAAGRDILSTYAYVGGPGLLEVTAGRNIVQTGYTVADQQVLYYGNFKTLGTALIAGTPLNLTDGADLTVMSGFGAGGSADYAGFARVYFDPAYQADLELPIASASNAFRVQLSYATPVSALLAQSRTGLVLGANGLQQSSSGLAVVPGLAASRDAGGATVYTLNGKVVDPAKISPLSAYLAGKYGYTGDAAGAPAYFASLSAARQQATIWHFYFLELNLAAFQYNDPASAYFRSYSRGSQAIDTLAPPRTELVDWLRAYHDYTGDTAGAVAAFNALPSSVDPSAGAPIAPPTDKSDPAYFRYLVWQNDLQVTTLASPHVSVFAADPTIFKSAAASEAAIREAGRTYGLTGDSPLALPAGVSGVPLSGLQGVPDGYQGTIQNASGPLAVNGAIGGSAVFDGGLSTRAGGTINIIAPGTPTDTPTLRANSVVLGTSGGVAPGGNTGVVAYGLGSTNLWSTGNQLLGQSRVFTLDGGNIIMWASAGDVNAGIGSQTSVTYNAPAYVYDATGGVFVTPPSTASGAGIGALQVIPGAAAGSVNLVAPIGTVDLGEAGARAAGNLNLLGRVLANTANAQAGRVATSNVSVTTSSVQALAASSANAASTAAAGADDKRKSDKQDPSVIEVEVVSIGGTFEDDERKRRRR